MLQKKFDDRIKKKAALRVQAGEKIEVVAADVGCAVRSLERWCAEAGVKRTEPATDKTAPVGPSDAGAPVQADPRRDRALKAMGGQSDNKVTPSELEAAAKLRASNVGDWCVGSIKATKGAALCLGAPFAGLDPSSKEITALITLMPFAEQQVRANAEALEPMLKKYLGENGGLVLCGLALLADVILTGYMVYGMAREKSKERKAAREKMEAEKKAAADAAPAPFKAV